MGGTIDSCKLVRDMLEQEYVIWCHQHSPTMYQKMCWWHDKAIELAERGTSGERKRHEWIVTLSTDSLRHY